MIHKGLLPGETETERRHRIADAVREEECRQDAARAAARVEAQRRENWARQQVQAELRRVMDKRS